MAKRLHIPITKVGNDQYHITKGLHLEFLVNGTYGLLKKISLKLSAEDNLVYTESVQFKNIIEKLLTDNPDEIFSAKDLDAIQIWLDSVCAMIIEMDYQDVDYADKTMRRYLRLAGNFLEEIKIHLEQNS